MECASAVRVRLTETNRVFELRVADNGRGITDAEIAHSESIGLLGMRERATQAGAALDLAGIPGKGTVITVRVPLPAKTVKRSTAPRPRNLTRQRIR